MAGSKCYLALLPIRGSVGPADALAAFERLERAKSVVVVSSAVIRREPSGAVEVSLARESVIGEAAWRWLLDEIADPDARPGLSESFVLEVRKVLPTAGEWVALVVSHLDAGAIVDELRAF